MILYFTGTGNSEYVANRISYEIEEEANNLFQRIRDNDYSELHSEKPWIVVTPTYAWRIPRILEKLLEQTVLSGSREIYFVMTCGDSIGNAGKYLKALCSKIQMNYLGCYRIIMPENYIAMFSTPTKDEAISIIAKAEAEIDKAIEFIKSGRNFPEPQLSLIDKMSSGIVNNLFYPLFVHAKKFYVTETCISCGLCEKVCPLNNIQLIDGKPSWSDNCTHCMACICRCPKEAIEYGQHSKGLPRYTFPK
ncbi:MAG: 4Fe-4S binding protein [Clostridiaceae bacterium]|nr:4Fe-4S binding protein [Clostridiaceae bacterium]